MGKTMMNPPILKKPVALILFGINIFAPGVGTMIAGLFKMDLMNVIVGVLQLVTAPILIGWIWSILWGWEMWQVARGKRLAIPGVGVV